MTLYELARLVLRRWLVIVVCTVLGLAAALVLAFVMPKSYSVQTQLFVSSLGASAADRVQNGEYARNRVSSYADLAKSPAVLDVVRADLGLTTPYYAMVTEVEAENPLDTAVINITVRDSSKQRAFEVAEQISKVMGPVVNRLETSDGVAPPVKISVVQPPLPPTEPDGLSKKVFALIGLVVGLAVGIGIAHVRETWQAWAVSEVADSRAADDRSTEYRPAEDRGLGPTETAGRGASNGRAMR